MSDDERREYQRSPVQIDITYDNDVFFMDASLKNLSIGGARILTKDPLPVGTKLSISFREHETPLDLGATVLRVVEEDPDEPNVAPSMAVRFTEVSAPETNLLLELINLYRESSQKAESEPVEEKESAEENDSDDSFVVAVDMTDFTETPAEMKPEENTESEEESLSAHDGTPDEDAIETTIFSPENISQNTTPTTEDLAVFQPSDMPSGEPETSSESASREFEEDDLDKTIEIHHDLTPEELAKEDTLILEDEPEEDLEDELEEDSSDEFNVPSIDDFATMQVAKPKSTPVDELQTIQMETSPFTPPIQGSNEELSPEDENFTTIPTMNVVSPKDKPSRKKRRKKKNQD